MSTLIDLGHRIYDGMAAYPGLPPARVSLLLTHEASRDHYEHSAEFALTKLDIAGNTGTYLDSPWHRHPGGFDIARIPLDCVADLPGVVVDATPARSGGRGVDVNVDAAGARGAALLIRTGWSRRWGSDEYWSDGPYLSHDAIERILDARPRLVGVDFSNVDSPADLERPAHTRLLDAEILIIEHLRELDRVPAEGFRFHCAPLAVEGAASMPVRPYALIEADTPCERFRVFAARKEQKGIADRSWRASNPDQGRSARFGRVVRRTPMLVRRTLRRAAGGRVFLPADMSRKGRD